MTGEWTQSELRRVCLVWQGRLRLLDWDVRCCFIPRKEAGEWLGHVEVLRLRREAWIQIVSLGEWEAPWKRHDVELVLVHELVHVSLWPLLPNATPGTERNVQLEQAVNDISRALVSGKRVRPDLAPPPDERLTGVEAVTP